MITTQDPYRQAELLTGALEDGVAEGEVDPYMAAAV